MSYGCGGAGLQAHKCRGENSNYMYACARAKRRLVRVTPVFAFICKGTAMKITYSYLNINCKCRYRHVHVNEKNILNGLQRSTEIMDIKDLKSYVFLYSPIMLAYKTVSKRFRIENIDDTKKRQFHYLQPKQKVVEVQCQFNEFLHGVSSAHKKPFRLLIPTIFDDSVGPIKMAKVTFSIRFLLEPRSKKIESYACVFCDVLLLICDIDFFEVTSLTLVPHLHSHLVEHQRKPLT